MLFSCYRWANGGTERSNNLPIFTQIVSYEVGISTQMWPGPVLQSCSIPQRSKGYKFFWSWSLTHCFLIAFWDGSWRHLPFCFTCWKPSSLASSLCLLALPLIESPRTTPQPTESESWLWQFDFFFLKSTPKWFWWAVIWGSLVIISSTMASVYVQKIESTE